MRMLDMIILKRRVVKRKSKLYIQGLFIDENDKIRNIGFTSDPLIADKFLNDNYLVDFINKFVKVNKIDDVYTEETWP